MMEDTDKVMQWLQVHFEESPDIPSAVESLLDSEDTPDLPCMGCTGRGRSERPRVAEVRLPRRAQMWLQLQQLTASCEPVPPGVADTSMFHQAPTESPSHTHTRRTQPAHTTREPQQSAGPRGAPVTRRSEPAKSRARAPSTRSESARIPSIRSDSARVPSSKSDQARTSAGKASTRRDPAMSRASEPSTRPDLARPKPTPICPPSGPPTRGPDPPGSMSRPRGRAQVLKHRLQRLSERPVGGSVSEMSSAGSELEAFVSDQVAPDGSRLVWKPSNDRMSVCSQRSDDQSTISAASTLPIRRGFSDRPIRSQGSGDHHSVCSEKSSRSTKGNLPREDTEGSLSACNGDAIENGIEGSDNDGAAFPEAASITPQEPIILDSRDQFKDSVTDKDPILCEASPPISRKKKTTLFERAFVESYNEPIVFENHVKFHGGVPKFKGFTMAHKHTPENFTMEQDFPELPADTIAPEAPPSPDPAPASIKDISACLLTDGTVSRVADRPLNSVSSLLEQYASETSSPTDVPTLYIRNLPLDLSDDGETLLLDTLQHYGEVRLFQLMQDANSKTARIRLDSLEAVELVKDCFHDNESFFLEHCLIAEISEED